MPALKGAGKGNPHLTLARRYARLARRCAEAYAHNHDSREMPWHKKPTLAGMCAMTSLFLWELLQAQNLKGWEFSKGVFQPKKGHPIKHCWVEHKSGSILDPTASQLCPKMPKVYLAPTRDPRYIAGGRTRRFPFWSASISPHAKNWVTGKIHIDHLREIHSSLKR